MESTPAREELVSWFSYIPRSLHTHNTVSIHVSRVFGLKFNQGRNEIFDITRQKWEGIWGACPLRKSLFILPKSENLPNLLNINHVNPLKNRKILPL